MIGMTLPPTNLKEENEVVLFPSPACREPDGSGWRVSVQGDVFTPADRPGLTKRLLLKVLQRLMKASDDVMRGSAFQRRIERFVAKDEGGKRVAVRVGDEVFPIPGKTQSNGHFAATLRIPNDLAARCLQPGEPGGADRLPIEVYREDGAKNGGHAFLLEPTGVSVISDIDDTIKLSQVGNRRSLLQNTFLNEFAVIEGMAATYQRWAAAGADFHYVSSSPWQLYDHLRDLFERSAFPAGTYHLRAFRLRDHFLRRILLLRRSNKANAIAALLRAFPQRKFYLIGDSGESDPETYGAVARRYPRQTAGIFIRALGPREKQHRFERAFRQLPPDLWRIFEAADELPDELRPDPRDGGPPKRAK